MEVIRKDCTILVSYPHIVIIWVILFFRLSALYQLISNVYITEWNTKITLEWVHKQFVTRAHTLFYFLHDITNPYMTLKRWSSHIIPVPCLARFTFCWWRHNRLAMTSQWPDNFDTYTWQVISNSFDIDFIHGDIRGRSCKNNRIIMRQWMSSLLQLKFA